VQQIEVGAVRLPWAPYGFPNRKEPKIIDNKERNRYFVGLFGGCTGPGHPGLPLSPRPGRV